MFEYKFYDKDVQSAYDEMRAAIPHFDGDTWHVVTISDSSGNTEEFIGVGQTFNDAKRALREGWKRLRKYYNEDHFSVDLLVSGRLKSYVL